MDAVPLALETLLTGSHKVMILKDHVLKSIELIRKQNEQLLKLTFDVISHSSLASVLHSTHSVLARHVILALPKEPIREVCRLSSMGTPEFVRALESVTAHPLFKLFLGYDRAWWEDPRALGFPHG